MVTEYLAPRGWKEWRRADASAALDETGGLEAARHRGCPGRHGRGGESVAGRGTPRGGGSTAFPASAGTDSQTGVSKSWGRGSGAWQEVILFLESRPRGGHTLVTLKRYVMGL